MSGLFFRHGFPASDLVAIFDGRKVAFEGIVALRANLRDLARSAANGPQVRALVVFEEAAAAAAYRDHGLVVAGPSLSRRRPAWQRLAQDFDGSSLGRLFAEALART